MVIAEKLVIGNVAIYLQHQGDPDEKHHESIKHTPAILDIGVIPLCRETSRVRQKGQKRENNWESRAGARNINMNKYTT